MNESVNWIVLSLAGIVLLVGLRLHFWSLTPGGRPHFNTTTNVAWLLIALFPVLVLFSIFPDARVEGTVLGISATGAVALFLVIWHFGPRHTRSGRVRDDLEQQVRSLEKARADLQDQLEQSQGEQPVPLRHGIRVYGIEGLGNRKAIEIITGDLAEVNECDCWVNSENTYMQMSRVFERSISAVIRYYGARRDEAGDVQDDVIADELKNALKGRRVVQPTSVFLTGAGALTAARNVRLIAHVAAVTGQVGVGWKPIDHTHRCVRSVLHVLQEDERAREVHSVLFPLMGIGQAGGSQDRDRRVEALFREAIGWLRGRGRNGRIDRVCFLAWTDVDLDSCLRVVGQIPELLPRA